MTGQPLHLHKYAFQLEYRLLSVNRITLEKDWAYSDTKSVYNRIYFIEEGSGLLRFSDGKEVRMEKNQIYFIPVGACFTLTSNFLRKVYIHFRLNVHGIDLFEIAKPEYTRFSLSTIDFPGLLTSGSAGNLNGVLDINSLIMNLAGRFLGKNHNQADERLALLQPYQKVLDYIYANLSPGLSIRSLSALVNLSDYYFSQKFKKTMGRSVKDFIADKLIEKSCAELACTGRKVREIADSLGFRDEYYFSRYFKQHTGQTPIQYRKKMSSPVYS